MKTNDKDNGKKNNKENIDRVTVEWQKFDAEVAREAFDPGDYDLARANLLRLVAVATALEAQLPQSMPEGVKKSATRMRLSCDFAQAFLWHKRRARVETPAGNPRNGVVAAAATAIGMVHQVATSKMRPDKAELARQTSLLVFGESAQQFLSLPAHELYVAVEQVRVLLEKEVELRQTLLGFVSEWVMSELFEANRILGEKLGISARMALPTSVDRGTVVTLLRRRIQQYVVQVLATAEEEGEGTLQRAMAALAPIVELREEVARGAAKAKAKAEVKAKQEDELEDEVEDELEEEEEEVDAPADDAVSTAPLPPPSPTASAPPPVPEGGGP